MDTSFLFDKFFVDCSVYTVDFVMPLEHSDILVDLQQLSIPFTALFLIQHDTDCYSCVTFVSAYSVGQFHAKLFGVVNKIRSMHKLNYNQFHYE